MSLAAGRRLGPYEIQSAIGAGGMGEVYKARDTRLDRSVASSVDFFLVPSTRSATISPVPERGAASARRAAASDSAGHVNSRAADERTPR